MARKVLVLDEVIAMMGVVRIPQPMIERFRTQAEMVVAHRQTKGDDQVIVSSGFGQKSQHGFVELTVNDVLTQMDVKKAREIGLMLIEAAEAATSDEIMLTLLERVGIGPEDVEARGRILLDLREIRQGTRGISRPV